MALVRQILIGSSACVKMKTQTLMILHYIRMSSVYLLCFHCFD